MKIVIASTRAPKVNGVQRALRKISALNNFGDIAVESMSVESGVAATPLSIEELMRGARQRAEVVFRQAKSNVKESGVVLAIGVEGGIHLVDGRAFLQSWACVFDGTTISFGSSGSIEIPAALSDAVVRDGQDLGKVIDVFAEQKNVRSNQGTWGILTNDIITREDSFELAAINALAPFFNKKMYDRGLPG